ncbi:MAG: glycosyltransferase family 2 protein [Anaerolineae bacterium]|nr:glycosyltransferase family 2 protein [Anaerolineae bacterium]
MNAIADVTPDVSVVIVSFNTVGLLTDCLDSLFRQSAGLRLEVIVVDNASHDGSAAMVRSQFPGVRLLCNEMNPGFARANNQALPLCQGRFLLLLNPDTVVLEGALQRLLTFMQEHPAVGMCGPRRVYPDMSDQRSSYPYPSFKGVLALYTGLYGRFPGLGRLLAPEWVEAQPGQTREVDWCSAACLMVSRACYEAVGGLDDGAFMYYEDTDWCRRARQSGWQVVYFADACVVHYLGGSQRADSGQYQRRLRELRGALYYLRKWHGPSYAALYRGGVRLCGAYRYARRRGRTDDPQELVYYRALALGR